MNVHHRIDKYHLQDVSWHQRLFLRLFRGRINAFVKCLIMRAYERSLIDSRLMHELAAMSDRMLGLP